MNKAPVNMMVRRELRSMMRPTMMRTPAAASENSRMSSPAYRLVPPLCDKYIGVPLFSPWQMVNDSRAISSTSMKAGVHRRDLPRRFPSSKRATT